EEVGVRLPFAGLRRAVGAPPLRRGERTLLGEIGERPGAAIRAGIQEKATGGRFLEGYRKGALLPEEVPRFEDIGEKIGKITPLVSLKVLFTF
ncbi:unnamed protein product, partial [marine sediment metagenome]